jgi:hypothetical protein
MKRTVLSLMTAGAAALFGFVVLRSKSSNRSEPREKIEETFWSKLRELWAIRQRCRQIKLEQRQNRSVRSNSIPASFLRRNSLQTTDLSQ